MLSEPAGQTCRAGVVGSPIRHSLSPVLHRAAYRALGLEGWVYTAADVPAGGLAGHLTGLGAGWAGLSVTMPLKEEALAAAVQVSDVAARTGAANTLLRRPDGTWAGDNTDVAGLRAALAGAGVERVDRASVIGSGATARSALAALAGLGLTELTVIVRDRVRPGLGVQAQAHGIPLRVVRYADAPAALTTAPLVVSTVPPGAAPAVDRVVPADGAVLLDVVYADWPTPLARHYATAGARVVDGLHMLVHQAVEQVRLMTGRRPPVGAMLAAGRAAAR